MVVFEPLACQARIQGGMEVPVSNAVLSILGKLRRGLQQELEELEKRRPGLEDQLKTLLTGIESRQRALKLLKATERRLAKPGRGESDLEWPGAGESTQVSGYSSLF
jgi:hypothetical protein